MDARILTLILLFSAAYSSNLYYVFDGVTGTVTDLSSGITGIFGSSTNFFPGDYDSDDAWPIKDRGYYFSKSIFHLPPFAGLTDSAIVVNNYFSIEMWLKSTSSGGNQ